jgi:threonine dehydratase
MFPNNKLSFSLSIYSPFLSPYLNQSRVILEPAGALAVAGLKKYVQEREITGQSMVAITSGANMDFDRLRFVSERADESEKTLAVKIPESPGSFRQLYSTIWPRNVTEFSYRYESDQEANIFISFQPVINIENDFVNIVEKLEGKGFACSDISHNELAKDHVRHLAGGRSIVPKERLFRFEFPESPGALQRFLTSLDMSWNVSLFHYRNHGDDFGRVLVGIQVGKSCARLEEFLRNLGYSYNEETDNVVYHQFLRNGKGKAD